MCTASAYCIVYYIHHALYVLYAVEVSGKRLSRHTIIILCNMQSRGGRKGGKKKKMKKKKKGKQLRAHRLVVCNQ